MAIIQQTVRNPDGTLAQVSFDTVTGQPVTGAAPAVQTNDAFTSDLKELGLAPTAPTAAQAPTTAQKVVSKPKENVGGGSRGEKGGTGYTTSAGPNDSKSFGSNAKTGQPSGRSAANNYGYTNKPAALGLAGMIPGPIGLAGKALNVGINASNVAATNKAREALGLGKKGFGENLGASLRDQKGHVADVKIGAKQYSVGLEAQDKYGRTTLTPEEGRKRAASLKSSIVEATPKESKARRASFAKENPGATGFFGRVKEGVGSIFSGIFGNDIKAAAQGKVPNSTSAMNPGGISIGKGGFPSAPSAPAGSSKGSSQYGGFSSAAGKARGESISPGAAGAIGKGSGGLY